MGVSVSSNVANQLNSLANEVAASFAQSCEGSIAQTTGLNLNNCPVNATEIDLNNTSNINITCLQSDTLKTSMQNAISDAVAQQAAAVTQSLGAPSAAVASSVTNASIGLANAVVTKFTQTCVNNISNSAVINCTNSPLNVKYIKINNQSTEYQSCVSNNTQESAAVNRLTEAIQQTSTAKEENSFNAIISAILIVIAIFAIFVINTASSSFGWIIIIGVILLVIGLVLYAFFAQRDGLYPFPKKQ